MADNKRRFSWTMLMGDGLLLLCALLGLTGSFLSLYADPNAGLLEITALDRCAGNGDLLLAYAALFGLITLAVWSLPRFRGGLAGALAAVWAGSVWWNWTEVVQGAGITVRDISALFARRVYWGKAFSYKPGLPPLREADAAQLFLLLTLAGLALLLGWAVVRSRRWWVVVLLTLPPLLPGLLADLYPDWLPFMALAACWCAMLLTSLCRWAATDGRGKQLLAVLPSVALVLALITALFPREGYTRPAWARKAQNDLMNLTNRLSDYFSRWDGPFRSTVTYVGSAGEADLAHAGPLNYSGRTVLRVTSDRGGWMFLRGSSLAVYEDGVWKALPSGTYDAYWSGQEPEVSPLYLPATLEQDSPVYTFTVDNIGAVGTCVYAPYFLLPQDVNETGMLPVEDAYLARKQGQWSHTMTFVDRRAAVSNGPATDAALACAEYVYENYLDVPEDLRELLEQWVTLTGFPPLSDSYSSVFSDPASYGPTYKHSGGSVYKNTYDAEDPLYVATVLLFGLHGSCQYDDSAPAAPEGVDPVYYFLTESHRGYCMHYASAMTLMLRAAGIPARYVSGFKAEIPSDRQKDIPDRAAHAWVEVWLDGFGWYPVEVTPADAFAWTQQSGILDPDDRFDDTPEPTPEPTETPEPTGAPDQPIASLPVNGDDLDGPEQDEPGLDFSALFNALKGAVPVVGMLLLFWSVQFAVKRLRARRVAGADANRSALVCYRYLCRLERWGGRMDARAVELAQKARFSQHTLTQEELSLLRHLMDRERSRLCVVSRLPRRLLFRYLWGRPNPPVPPADWTPPEQEQ